MTPFCFRPRRSDEDYDTYEQAFIGAWDFFCSQRRLNPYPAQPTGDRYLDACSASAAYAEGLRRSGLRGLRRKLGRLTLRLATVAPCRRPRQTPGK
ncbi:hypothetical protein [Streptomyces sp. NPDC091416]|uniref:hypothetical protein n=1 Tax=Streptomyces sp. NPDC091416 TaxID=3366003 RepID=UPI00381C7E28